MMTNAHAGRTDWLTPQGRRHLVIYLTITAVLIALALRGSAGFSYSLDDPYIHLALAQHILQGTYGINAGEVSSPASSVVWPLLLVPFVGTALAQWVPLLLNVMAGCVTSVLLGAFVHRFYPRIDQLSPLAKWIFATLTVIAASLPALTMMGMEQTLQVLLATGCAWAIAAAYTGRAIPTWALVCATVAPAVRYENLAFTLAVAIACLLQRRRGTAVVVFATSLLPLIALGLFLHAHGLPVLPNSVLVKGGLSTSSTSHPALEHFIQLAATNWRAYVSLWDHRPITLLFLAILVQAVRVRTVSVQRNALLAALIGLALLMTIGPYGYFYRYDVCYRLFAFLVVLVIAADFQWFRATAACALAFVASWLYFIATVKTPLACWQIAHEQKQMARLAHDFYGRNIAVNDLGWVSFDSHDRFYILDLAGLASNEAARQQNKDAAWLAAITREHNVGLVVVYKEWFPQIPAEWRLAATLHRGGGQQDAVRIYATPSGDSAVINASLQRFASALPGGSWLTFDR